MPRTNYKPTGNPAHRPPIVPGETMKKRDVMIGDRLWDHCRKQKDGAAAYIRRLIDQDMAHNSGEREKEESK